MVIIKDCSHFLHQEKPIATTKYLLRFFDDIDAKRDLLVDGQIVTDVEADFYENSFNSKYIYLDNDAISVEECKRDYKMIEEKRAEMPLILAPFRGHKGFGLLHFVQAWYRFRYFCALKRAAELMVGLVPFKKNLTQIYDGQDRYDELER